MTTLTRLLLIALMLVLLPLRGWAGNVMAIDMAVTTAARAGATQDVMPRDCAMHTQTAADDTAPLCSNCDTCELCLAVANPTIETSLAAKSARQASPAAFNASFSSATRAPGFKPPIF